LRRDLQAVPTGLIFGVFSLYLVWTNDSKNNPSKTQNLRMIGLLVGAITFPIAISIYLSINSLWYDFFVFYLQDNFMYAISGSQDSVFLRLIKLLKSSPDFWLLLGVLFLGLKFDNFNALKKERGSCTDEKFNTTYWQNLESLYFWVSVVGSWVLFGLSVEQ
jgi:hypothetical protein